MAAQSFAGRINSSVSAVASEPSGGVTCNSENVKEIVSQENHAMTNSSVEVFKMPSVTMSSESRQLSSQTSCHASAPSLILATPEKQVLPSPTAVKEVRKRSMELSTTESQDVFAKKKNVSKSLFNTSPLSLGSMKGKSVSRCIFGAPTKEQQQIVMKEYDQRVQKEYEAFAQRYVIVDEA